MKIKVTRVMTEYIEMDNPDIDEIIEFRDLPANKDILLIELSDYTIIGQAHEDYNDNAIAFDYR